MKSALKHVIDKINSATMNTDIPGYPHFNINELFPEDYYLELVENLKSMDHNVFSKLSKNYQNRYIYDLNCGENINRTRQSFEDLKSNEIKFWTKFQETFLVKDDFKKAFYKKYEDYIDFPNCEEIGQPACRIQRDFKGYSIGPHRDRLDKIFSVMIYAPTVDDLTEELIDDHGTVICIPKFNDPETVPQKIGHVGTGTDRHFLFEDVEIVKTAPSLPNSLYSWAVADRSYHGVTPLKSDKVRSTIAYFVKIPKQYSQYHRLYGWDNFKT
tara:strand:- start:1646 stop:2455 length:810 start_codon:yes stop_codon:yes gene_type:complete